MKRKKFPVSLAILIFFISIVNALATIFSLYWRIRWLDMPMHFLSGFWIGSVALWFLLQNTRNRYLSVFLISVGAVFIIGSLWELFEFNVNPIVYMAVQNGVTDTVSDMTFDIIGGVVASVYFMFKK